MRSVFPSSTKMTESMVFGEHRCDLYTWKAPDGTSVATHMVLPCPNCEYPLSLAVSEFDFDTQTLQHKIKCPGRWRKGHTVSIDDESVFMAELNDKGKPVILRCGWSGYLINGDLKDDTLDTSEAIRQARSG